MNSSWLNEVAVIQGECIKPPLGCDCDWPGRESIDTIAAMSHLTLADVVDDLQRSRQLTRIAAEVNPDLELAAIAQRAADESGPAILFGRIAGRDSPLVINLLGSLERINRALELKSLDDLRSRAEQLLQPASPAGWLDSLRLSPPQARWAPRIVKNGVCQQVVHLASDVNLGQFFNVKWWPEEEAPSLPAALVFVQAPDDAWRSMEFCSATLLDQQRLLLGWEPHRSLARLWRKQTERRERLPVAMSLGGHPAELLAAAAPLGVQVDRWALCGWLRDRSCDLVRSRTLPLEVPADAEIILEGYLDPSAPPVPAPRRAGLSGFYSLPGDGVVMHVTAVTHRTNPLPIAIAPRKPPHDLGVMRAAMLEALKPLLLGIVPGLVDFHLPAATACRNVAIVSIEKSLPQQARQIAGALWALEPWMFARLLVVVDADADVCNKAEILHRITSHADLSRDTFQQSMPCELDHHASPASGVAALMGIDATRKMPAEQGHTWPNELKSDQRIAEQVNARWESFAVGGNGR